MEVLKMFKTLKGWFQLQQQERQALENLQQQRFGLEEQIKSLHDEIDKLSELQGEAQKAYDDKVEQTRKIDSAFDTLMEVGYEHYVPTMQDNDLEKRIFDNELCISQILDNNTALFWYKKYTVDGSSAKGKRFQDSYGKSLLIGFNTYAQKKTKAITQANYYKTIDLVKKCYEKYNKLGGMVGISITSKYLDYVTDNIKLTLELKIFRAKEREKLKEERRKIREQEKLLEEARKEKEKLEFERKELSKLFSKHLTEQERKSVNAKIAKIDKRINDIDWRVEHTSAGWLYIATTPCLQNMIKIGCTRQLNPLMRLAQLSSASVPYPFECKGLVFSEEVFDLEAKVHQFFNDKRVNKENIHKEFFYASEQEVIKVLEKQFNQKIHFADEDWLENPLK